MALVSLVAIYLLLTIMPYFFVEIASHKITVDLSYKIDSKVMHWITDRDFELKITNGTRQFGNSTVW